MVVGCSLSCPYCPYAAKFHSKGILYEQGGEALLESLRAIELPARASGPVREALRKLIGYFENNRHRS